MGVSHTRIRYVQTKNNILMYPKMLLPNYPTVYCTSIGIKSQRTLAQQSHNIQTQAESYQYLSEMNIKRK